MTEDSSERKCRENMIDLLMSELCLNLYSAVEGKEFSEEQTETLRAFHEMSTRFQKELRAMWDKEDNSPILPGHKANLMLLSRLISMMSNVLSALSYSDGLSVAEQRLTEQLHLNIRQFARDLRAITLTGEDKLVMKVSELYTEGTNLAKTQDCSPEIKSLLDAMMDYIMSSR